MPAPSGHQQGPNCPCAGTLQMDEHPHKCKCGGYYHIVNDGFTTSFVCDVCGKDNDPYPTGELRI